MIDESSVDSIRLALAKPALVRRVSTGRLRWHKHYRKTVACHLQISTQHPHATYLVAAYAVDTWATGLKVF
jgi:hypothetical protein